MHIVGINETGLSATHGLMIAFPLNQKENAMVGEAIGAAAQEIAQRKVQRNGTQMDMRGFMAAEVIADELTLMRAEMTTMRELLAMIQAKIK